MKHVETKQLWLQEIIRRSELVYSKIPRSVNSADLLTKHWGSANKHLYSGLNYYPKTEEANAQMWQLRSSVGGRRAVEGGCRQDALLSNTSKRDTEQGDRGVTPLLPVILGSSLVLE